MASKSSVLHAKCPVCKKDRSLAHLLQGHKLGMYWGNPDRLSEAARKGELHWACEVCLAVGKALRGDPSKQFFGIGSPYLAYHDLTLRCTDCARDFVFTAADQQFGYEQLRFIVYARPKQCLPCRQKRREQIRLHAELAQALHSDDMKNPKHLANIAELYLRLGSRKKGLEFVGRARNLARRLGDYDELIAHLNELKE